MADPQMRRDVEAALAARRELGPEYDDQVAAGLADRIDELVAIRLADQRGEVSERQAEREDANSSRTQRFVLGIISIGGGIPITAISSGSVVMTAVAWAGIVGVNVAAAWGSRRHG
jgi:hypothetical protein